MHTQGTRSIIVRLGDMIPLLPQVTMLEMASLFTNVLMVPIYQCLPWWPQSFPKLPSLCHSSGQHGLRSYVIQLNVGLPDGSMGKGDCPYQSDVLSSILRTQKLSSALCMCCDMYLYTQVNIITHTWTK